MRYQLEVDPGEPRAIAIVTDALKSAGIDAEFEPMMERRGADQVFEVARGTFELVGDVMIARAAIKRATEKWPSIKARITELGPSGGRHR